MMNAYLKSQQSELAANLRRLRNLERACSRLESMGGDTLLVAAENLPYEEAIVAMIADQGRPILQLLIFSSEVFNRASLSLSDIEERRLLQEAPGLNAIKTLRLLQKAWEQQIKDLNKALSLEPSAQEVLAL